MGILRTDRVSGLGGANAITGSVRFHGKESQDDLQLDPSSDFNLGTGDYTIEAWVYPVEFSRSQMIFAVSDSDSAAATGKFYLQSSNRFVYWAQGSARISSSSTFTESRWYHVALVNNSGTQTIYVDGTSQGTSTYSGGFGSDTFEVSIGRNPSGTTQSMNGYISNIRVTKGTALYTGTFTPPTTRLTKRSDTVLLACNSASNVLNEETGKSILSVTSSTNNTGPVASRFTPNSPVGFSTTTDVGTQFGSTFDGVTTFDSQAYFVPPSGNTRERNRGRALWAGGDNPGGPNSNVIDFIQIQSGGIGLDFGDLTAAGNQARGVSSFTRGVFGGGRRPHPSTVNTMDFVTIANAANAQDFGDLTDDRGAVGEISSSTRGIFAAGFNPSNVNTIDFITIATLGNASDFGDATIAANAMAGTQSTTRGILGGGYPSYNVIQFLTIATTGNAQDFGDLTDSRHSASGTSNGVRAVFMGGDHASPAADNTIDFITIASTGNATDFGDLGSISIGTGGATSDKIRGVFGTGYNGSNYLNVIQQVTIATTGNSVDIGELTLLRHQPACLGDAHGGLSE